jgi:2-phospho-L-lactate transferase
VGLTSVCLGLVRALDREGRRVAFHKPIRQPGDEEGPERSSHFVRETSDIDPPEPIPFARAAELLRSGDTGRLLEEVVERYQRAADGAEVVVVEGLVATAEEPGMDTLNQEIVTALDAEVILATTAVAGALDAFVERVQTAARLYGGTDASKVLGCVVNRVGAPQNVTGAVRTTRDHTGDELTAEQIEACPIFDDSFHLLGAVPWSQQLASPRTRDVATYLGAQVLNEGEIDRRRVVDVSLCARTVVNMTSRLRPDALIVTPGDRDDIILATCMAAVNGVPLAGLLLTSGIEPAANVVALCERAYQAGLPVLLVQSDSYMTAADCASMDAGVPIDDLERIERVMDEVARLGGPDWFRLGDFDLATHLVRSHLLAQGQTLTAVTRHLCQQFGVQVDVLPMSDRPAPTIIETDTEKLSFQTWFVRQRWQPPVKQVHLPQDVRATPRVMRKLEECDVVVIAPSNPFVSVDPILNAYPVREMVMDLPQVVVAVSPIIGGQAVKGPAAKMMRERGMAVTATAVADYYGELIDGFVYDRQDAGTLQKPDLAQLCVDTWMKDRADRARLAQDVMTFATQLVEAL